MNARRLVLTALAALAVAVPAARAANVVADGDASVRMAVHTATRSAQGVKHAPAHVTPGLRSYPR